MPIDGPATATRAVPVPSGRPGRDPAEAPPAVADGLVRLVLTLVKLLHDVLERQAVRRMAGGQLTAAQIESVGLALCEQARQIEGLRRQFGFASRDLDLRLGLSGAPA